MTLVRHGRPRQSPAAKNPLFTATTGISTRSGRIHDACEGIAGRSSGCPGIRTRSRSSRPSRCSTPTRRSACRCSTSTGRSASTSPSTRPATGAADGARLRDRHHSGPVHLLRDGGEHGDDADARHRATPPSATTTSSRTTTCYGNGPMPGHPRLSGTSPRVSSPRCEERYGHQAVEQVLDAAHALMSQGVHRYPRKKRPTSPPSSAASASGSSTASRLQRPLAHTCRRRPRAVRSDAAAAERRKALLELPQENILYFLEKVAPRLRPWQREILRIVRLVAQYFYPQRTDQGE